MNLTYHMERDDQRGILRLKVEGTVVNSADLVSMFTDVFENDSANGLKGILLDAAKLAFDCTSIDVMETYRVFEKRQWLRGLKLARLVPKDNFWHNLVAEYANEINLPVKNFSQESAAIEWLLK